MIKIAIHQDQSLWRYALGTHSYPLSPTLLKESIEILSHFQVLNHCVFFFSSHVYAFPLVLTYCIGLNFTDRHLMVLMLLL